MNSITHLDRYLTRSPSHTASPDRAGPVPSRSLPASPRTLLDGRNTPPLLRRRSTSSDPPLTTQRRPRPSSPGSLESTSFLSSPVAISDEDDDGDATQRSTTAGSGATRLAGVGGRRRRPRPTGQWKWGLSVLFARLWQLVVTLLIWLGLAGGRRGRRLARSASTSSSSSHSGGSESRRVSLSPSPKLGNKTSTAATAGNARDEDEGSELSTTTSSLDTTADSHGPITRVTSDGFVDPRTQASPSDSSHSISPSISFEPPTPSPALPAPLLPLAEPIVVQQPPPAPDAAPPRSKLLLLPTSSTVHGISFSRNPPSASPSASLHLLDQPTLRSSRSETPPADRAAKRTTPFHRPKTLILDLDETLIHSTSRPSGLGGGRKGEGHMVEVFLNGRSTVYHVYKRPYVDFFLKKISSWYTIVIFTASMQEYADPVIDWLDGGRGMFSKRLFRDSCVQHSNGAYIKDLSCLNEDLQSLALIDNSPISYSFHQANGIPIDGWFSDPNDQALLDLLPVLDSLRFTADVRHVLGLRGF